MLGTISGASPFWVARPSVGLRTSFLPGMVVSSIKLILLVPMDIPLSKVCLHGYARSTGLISRKRGCTGTKTPRTVDRVSVLYTGHVKEPEGLFEKELG